MNVQCSVTEINLENDNGLEIESVEVTCSRCKHAEQSFGTSERSVRRCAFLLRENCPKGEKNFYEVET
jgi:hypothetical protein